MSSCFFLHIFWLFAVASAAPSNIIMLGLVAQVGRALSTPWLWHIAWIWLPGLTWHIFSFLWPMEAKPLIALQAPEPGSQETPRLNPAHSISDVSGSQSEIYLASELWTVFLLFSFIFHLLLLWFWSKGDAPKHEHTMPTWQKVRSFDLSANWTGGVLCLEINLFRDMRVKPNSVKPAWMHLTQSGNLTTH